MHMTDVDRFVPSIQNVNEKIRAYIGQSEGIHTGVHPIPGSWIGFLVQASQAFYPSGATVSDSLCMATVP